MVAIEEQYGKIHELVKENAGLKAWIKNLREKINSLEKMDNIKQVQGLTAENSKLRELLRDACNELKQRELAQWLTELVEKALEE